METLSDLLPCDPSDPAAALGEDVRRLLDAIPFGVAAISPDRRVVMFNQAMETLTGFSRERATGLPCSHVLRLNCCLRDCPARRKPLTDKPVSFEADILSCDRQKVPVRGTFSAVHDRAGNVALYLETFEDLRAAGRSGDVGREAFKYGQIIARSPEMERVFATLPALAGTDASLLITGETGTGKDVVAEAIHHGSHRARGPFIKVNCGALPENLLESELFGHKKGAFTGAVDDKPGRIQLAHNGTLFLTEIGDLPLALQVKLLTFLDDRVIYPLGGTKGFMADVRLIAATHLDLAEMVRQSRFRKDLLFRLNVIRIHLPPLRERQGDVGLLLEHFLKHFSRRLDKRFKGFSPSALARLLAYPFPGNVRELRNIVEYACTLARDPEIDLSDLPPYLSADPMAGASLAGEISAPPSLGATLERGVLFPGQTAPSLDELERRRILEALNQARGRKGEAAKLLGLGRSTLWRKLKRHGLVTGEEQS